MSKYLNRGISTPIVIGIIAVLIYKFIYSVDISHNILRIFLPQALVAGVLSPALFSMFDRLEVLLNAGSTR